MHTINMRFLLIYGNLINFLNSKPVNQRRHKHRIQGAFRQVHVPQLFALASLILHTCLSGFLMFQHFRSNPAQFMSEAVVSLLRLFAACLLRPSVPMFGFGADVLVVLRSHTGGTRECKREVMRFHV